MSSDRPLMLLTGADGFIGSHLTEALLNKGFKVRALAQYNSFNNWGHLEEVVARQSVLNPSATESLLEIVTGDVRDPDFCRTITKGVDTVFHLAALIAIPYSYIAPDSYVDTNIKGTLNMCQAARDEKVRRILVTSTSEVYGTALYVPIDEKHPRQPQSPYSASKIGADAIAMSFYNAFNLPITVVRPFNTYGPRQSARAFIPTVITQIATGITDIKVGDLRPTRDFNYVEDTVAGFLSIAECDETIGMELNIATGKDVSMKETLGLIEEIMDRPVNFTVDPNRLRPDNSEVMRLQGDSSLLRSLTGWEPKVSLKEGLTKTIEWFTQPANLSRFKPTIYNI